MLDALSHAGGRRPGADPSNRLAAALLARSEIGLLALDSGMRVAMANEAALTLLGVPCHTELDTIYSMIGRAALLAPSSRAALAAWLEPGCGPTTCVALIDGRTLAVESAAGPDGHLLLSFKRGACTAAPPGRTDPLTGLADRTWFMDRVAGMMGEPGGKVAVLMIDLDRFKAVNDSLGHPVGDALLQLVAKRLCATLRGADVISRFGGDEFAVAMPRAVDPEAIGRRVVSVLSRPYLVERSTASIGASVGVSLGPEHGRDGVALIRAADIALYAAKQAGRGTVRMFDPELDRLERKRHALADDLRKAIPLRQLELHYQPQMNLMTRELTGFEALVRWRHPEHGLVPPDSFIPIAEETGFIWPLGEWVLRVACREAVAWPDHLAVAVNVSPKQLLDRHRLTRVIKTALAQTGLAPHRLEIEITESALIREAQALAVLTSVRQLGVRISMDDFGTGYSSLSQLRRFPFDKLKIDRSFVRDLGSSEEAAAVVRAIAALGRSLGMTTIAEGVETEEQQDRVLLDGCTEMQGYLLSRPVPAREVRGIIDALSRPASEKESVE